MVNADKDFKKAREWVLRLQKDGAVTACEDTNEEYNDDLPSYYDSKKFRKGQQFFHDNIFAMFFAKMIGLITILTIPTILKMLIFTRMSGENMTAYRRYLSTLFHMHVWYTSDFTPGSKLWQSIREVKNKHNSASNRGCKAGLQKISQRDMALTQFGFMGYAMCKSEEIGIFNAKHEELESFVHLWRVIGYIMGIEDRFNICRGSVDETRAICDALIREEFAPAFRNRDKDFLKMSSALCEGMWSMNPILNTEVFTVYIAKLLRVSGVDNNNKEKIVDLSFGGKMHFAFLKYAIMALQFSLWKWYRNLQMRVDLWLMHNFPFLAYYRFGYANSHVTVLEH